MRQITDHKVNGLNEALDITVLDEPGSGCANHVYQIEVNGAGVADYRGASGPISENPFAIRFQNGPIKEAGVNGISNEALIAIVIDRMRGFQSGPFASRDNAVALTKLDEALMWLQKRTRDRMARGVEGTLQQ